MGTNTRGELAKRRLRSVLGRHVVATMRTLEQKISDAGPTNQRINPHVLTPARDVLLEEGLVVRLMEGGVPWFHLADEAPDLVRTRLDEQSPIHLALQQGDLSKRIGQCLEIAIYRALLQQHRLEFFGHFRGAG